MGDRIKKWKFFDAFQYKQEEEYLRKMHKEGYALYKIHGLGLYEFEKINPEDMVYKIDFPGKFENKEDKEAYLQLFKDSAWEYMGETNEYTYFRKKASKDENLDIFSDKESKKQTVNKIYKYRLYPLMITVFALIIMDLGEGVTFESSTFTKVATILSMISIFLGVIVSISLTRSYLKVMEEISKEER